MEQSQSTQAPTQSKDNQNASRIAVLVRAGLLKTSELPLLRQARLRQQQQPDIARLSKQHRDILSKYNNAISTAALGSNQSVMAVRRNLMQHYDITDKDQITEAAFKDEMSPPPMIVLKRKGIRIFPDGRKVALYQNPNLGLVVTIPFTNDKTSGAPLVPGVQTEEADQVTENIEHIKDIVDKHQAKKLKFQDGSSMTVDATTAKAIHLVHGALNDENKAKVTRMLSHSKNHFMKVADFAMKNTQFKINK